MKSREEHTLQISSMKSCLNVFLKYLTPSAGLRYSRSRRASYKTASPTRPLFSAGPRFPASSTARSSQSSISSSNLNQDIISLKCGGIFAMIPLETVVFICWCCAVRFNHSFGRAYIFCWKNWDTIKISSTSLINGVTGTLNTSHWRQILFSIRSSSSCNNQHSPPRPLCDFFLSVDRRWREHNEHQKKTHKIVMIVSLQERYWQQVSKMMISKIVSTNSVFRHNAHEWNHTVFKLTNWSWIK